jgi:hypothetical protein
VAKSSSAPSRSADLAAFAHSKQLFYLFTIVTIVTIVSIMTIV